MNSHKVLFLFIFDSTNLLLAQSRIELLSGNMLTDSNYCSDGLMVIFTDC